MEEAICPPHANTGFGEVAVKLIVMVLLVLEAVEAQPDSP
jgi:hypothetical protein